MIITYLALGSNLNNPFCQIKTALTTLDKIPKTNLIKTSEFYRTIPYGLKNQPDYLNTVVKLETELSVIKLLEFIHKIELKQGRIRKKERWGPRTLDIDILLFGNEIINTNNLTIPHYDMINRIFMLLPLIQIAPNIILPNGNSINSAIAKLNTGIIKLWKA
ncbi:2-amino-4-hydroxy-6-hydroxymethyldihydropteridine diphosphokinase [Candidatus Pantoea edessiphila]|uniref:2-amino-4-hydroxy-6-hydroxymethyldihydropteridine pyrophosphokinase n=1 Tax=Candidatus Pantoea edessiphila TaxID=2044610 RepID=A0A2P5T238_9GAMM|nr:2-amino-4-hydroxy-6-hydroxymethyldihydropteridine diphosphokinase [Candidatus Pantoea edessiphila]PPI88664.1 2-amino-4-hydroxy-6-hydroxymethyldihydropteridine diphosphokinase [Candidatus Pantoea edessiphila]